MPARIKEHTVLRLRKELRFHERRQVCTKLVHDRGVDSVAGAAPVVPHDIQALPRVILRLKRERGGLDVRRGPLRKDAHVGIACGRVCSNACSIEASRRGLLKVVHVPQLRAVPFECDDVIRGAHVSRMCTQRAAAPMGSPVGCFGSRSKGDELERVDEATHQCPRADSR